MTHDGEDRDQPDESDEEEQEDRDPGAARGNPRVVREVRGPEGVELRPERAVAIPGGGMAAAAAVVVEGSGIGDERGGVVVALHWRGGGSASEGARVPELRHGSPRAEGQLRDVLPADRRRRRRCDRRAVSVSFSRSWAVLLRDGKGCWSRRREREREGRATMTVQRSHVTSDETETQRILADPALIELKVSRNLHPEQEIGLIIPPQELYGLC